MLPGLVETVLILIFLVVLSETPHPCKFFRHFKLIALLFTVEFSTVAREQFGLTSHSSLLRTHHR